MKRIVCLAVAAILILALAGCHKHTPGPEATCTADQVCTECGEVLQEALGHEAAEEATCAHDQICVRCGEVLAPALPHTPDAPATCTTAQSCSVCGVVLVTAKGHSVDENGLCTVCGAKVCESGQTYIAPGKGAYTDTDAESIVAETENSGHYNNDIGSYYASAVLVCGDYGVEYFSPDPTGSGGYADIVNSFVAKHPDVHVTALLIPKCCAYESPADEDDPHDSTVSFINSTYAMMDSSVRKADCAAIMDEHAGEYMFYRTDHHWTSLGAYYASEAYCIANDIEVRPLDSYESVVRGGVTGTLYMYSNHDGNLQRNPDYTVCRFPAVGYFMQCLNGGWYNGIAVKGDCRDYASVFINGDNPLTVITTDNKNGKTLMLFKESYGNAFTPYMIDYYEKIIVVDIRAETDSVSALMEQYGVTDVLFINNVQAAVSLQDSLRSKALS